MKYLPRPDFLAFSLPETHIALVTNDGSVLTAEVVKLLEQEGNRVVVLNLNGHTSAPVNTESVTLQAVSDEAVQQALTTIQESYGKVGTFIHLHPHLEFENGNFAQHFETEKALVSTVFLLAKHLQQPLNELGKTQRANFLTVTRLDGKIGLGKRGNIAVVGGGLNGLLKSLNQEWAPVYCRAVDIQPEIPTSQIASHVIAELHDADNITLEVGISDEGRHTIAAVPVTVPEEQAIETKVTKDSVFLVSGGAKGVTATCVIEMARKFQCKFILLGRSNIDFELPAFAKTESDANALKRLIMEDLKQQGEKPTLDKVKKLFKKYAGKKEVEDTLAQIANHGGQAVYLQADVTDVSAIKAKLLPATQKLGPITGVIHGAGRLADKFVQDKSLADFQGVLSVKVDGLLALLACVNIHKLEHLILFSSVAGFYGNVGQTDYAAANEILSKAAHLFKTNHPNTHVSAINWGAWDSGMVSPELKKKFEEAGIALISSEGGAAMIINELNSDYDNQPQVIIGGTMPPAFSYVDGELNTYQIKRHLTLEENPFLNHHVIQGNAVLPVVNAVGWMAQVGEVLYPGYRVFKVENTKLFKGVVFDGSQPKDYTLEIKEIEKSAEQIVVETTVLSEGKKLPTYHYKAKVTLVNQTTKLDIPTFQHQVSGHYEPTPGHTLYEDGSLFHGKYFQGIEQVLDWNEKQIVLACKAPNVPLADQGQFPIISVNTFFSDIQYQGMVIWVQRYNDGAKSLPLQTTSATLYQPVPFEKELLVNVKIVEADDFKMVANCTVYDADGKVYMITEGATVTVSKQLKFFNESRG